MTTQKSSIVRTLAFALPLGAFALLAVLPARAEQAPATAATAAKAVAALPSVKALTSSSEGKVNGSVTFEGFVTGVCRNGGKKVFVHDSNRDIPSTIRVDKTNELPAFEPTLVGKTIRVTGILREQRIDAAYLDSWEAKTKGVAAPASASKDTTADHCTEVCAATEGQKATLKRIEALRAQLAKSTTGHLSFFSVDGLSWELVEAK